VFGGTLNLAQSTYTSGKIRPVYGFNVKLLTAREPDRQRDRQTTDKQTLGKRNLDPW